MVHNDDALLFYFVLPFISWIDVAVWIIKYLSDEELISIVFVNISSARTWENLNCFSCIMIFLSFDCISSL